MFPEDFGARKKRSKDRREWEMIIRKRRKSVQNSQKMEKEANGARFRHRDFKGKENYLAGKQDGTRRAVNWIINFLNNQS